MHPPPPNDCRTVSAKLPAQTAAALDQIAEYRGVSRSYLIRELAEAAAEGRVILKPPPRNRRRAKTLAELGASDVGRAVRDHAQRVAAAACDDFAAAEDVGPGPRDVHAVAVRAARLIAEGR